MKMSFNLKLSGIKENPELSQCLAAAINPKRFERLVQRGETEKIEISNLCDQMRQELAVVRVNPSNSRFLLDSAGRFIYGAVRIYQQQVQCLYKETNQLLLAQSGNALKIMFENFGHQNINYTQTILIKKSLGDRGKTKDLLKDEHQYIFDISNNALSENEVYELLRQDEHCGKPNDFLIHDISKDVVFDYDDEDAFGIITEADMRSLIDTLRDTEDDDNEDNQSLRSGLRSLFKSTNQGQNNKLMDTINNNNELIQTKDIPKNILDNEAHQEVDLIREAFRPEEILPQRPDFPDISDASFLIPMNESHIGNLESIGLLQQPMDITDTVGDQLPIAAVVPNRPGQSNDSLVELPKTKRRRRKAPPKLDLCTQIAKADLVEQHSDYNDTLRCWHPRQDVVPIYKLHFVDSKAQFKMPSRNLATKSLQNAFERNLKSNKCDIDVSILDDILSVNPSHYAEVFPQLHRNVQQKRSNHQENFNETNQINEQTAANLPPFEINVLETANPSKVIQDNHPFNECEFPLENPLFLLLKDDLLKDFEAPKDGEEATKVNSCNSTELNRDCWGKEFLLKKLLYLWKKKVKPITMNLLCQGAQRKDAAFAFYSLIELNAHQYVELTKNDNNEIANIEMGSKIVQKLNGNF